MPLVSHLFRHHAQAEAALVRLQVAGFPDDVVALLGNQPGDSRTDAEHTLDDQLTESGAGTGATIGSLVGGGAGVLAGIGMLAIPGLGPLIAAGWMVTALAGAGAGAALGGVIGALTDEGLSEEDAKAYAEGLREGGTLVTVRCEDADQAATARLALEGRMDPIETGPAYA